MISKNAAQGPHLQMQQQKLQMIGSQPSLLSSQIQAPQHQ
jgi:hypothetical protein